MQKHCRLRLITCNLWHGLDHTNPYLMLPAESPLTKWRRRAALLKGLKALQLPKEMFDNPASRTLEIFCFQEVNPLGRECYRFKKELQMDGSFAEINVGVRSGPFSYPLFLQEGLATLFRGALANARFSRHMLSGSSTEWEIPVLKWPVTVQLAERRGSLLLTGTWAGLKIAVVNLHLHHGPPTQDDTDRRLSELLKLFDECREDLDRADLAIVLGDFNAEARSKEFELLQEAGFEALTVNSQGGAIPTWDPMRNHLCARSVALNKVGLDRDWDAQLHQFDHMFVRKGQGFRASWTSRAERIFDSDSLGAWISDHYGLTLDLSWEMT